MVKQGHVTVSGAGVLGTDCKIIEFMHPDVLECLKFDQAQVVKSYQPFCADAAVRQWKSFGMAPHASPLQLRRHIQL